MPEFRHRRRPESRLCLQLAPAPSTWPTAAKQAGRGCPCKLVSVEPVFSFRFRNGQAGGTGTATSDSDGNRVERTFAMDALEAILTRRSIRRYTSDHVSDETVLEILGAAMAAPTGANEPWDFVVVRDRTVLQAVSGFHPHAEMLKQAAVAVVVCGDPTRGRLEGRWPLDCAACTQNILIAANAMGLGACWVGIYPVEERIQGLRRLLGMPDRVVPLCMVSLGLPAEKKGPSNRFKPERVHNERW